MKRFVFAACAALTLSPLAATASPVVQTESVRVSEIGSPEALRVAEARIRAAARRVCEAGAERELDQKAAKRECATQAASVAIAKLHANARISQSAALSRPGVQLRAAR